MTSVKEGSGNGSRKNNVLSEREQRKLVREMQKEQDHASKQAQALAAAQAAAATGNGATTTTDGQAQDVPQNDQDRRVMLEMRQAQESFLSMQGGDAVQGTPPLQIKSTAPGSPPPLGERSASRQGNCGDIKNSPPAPDLTPVMMVEDKVKDGNDSSPFSDNQQVPDQQQGDGTGEDVVIPPPLETEQERKLNAAAVKAVLLADAEEQARLQAQSPAPTGSSASQAARKLEEAKAAQQNQQPRNVGLPNRPSPPSRQNSNVTPGGTPGGGGAVNMPQQHSSNSSHGSGNTSTSWIPNPVAALRGLSGGQRAGTGALNATGGPQQDAAIYKEWQNALQENKILREDKRKLTNSLSEQEGFVRSLENTVRSNENQKRQQMTHINALTRDLTEARRELDQHRRLLAQVREQYALVDGERLKFATQLSETAKLLDSRTLELRTAETFLTKYDDTPGDEVVGIVNDINSQVLNIGGKVAEEIAEVFTQNAAKDPDRKVNVDIVNELVDVIGAKLVNILLKADFVEDPTPVQLAVQSMLVNGIYTILLTWPISPINSFGRDFWGLYKSILKSEVQPVASRWRALGSKHYRQNSSVNIHNFAVEGMLSHISKILLVAGVYAPTNEHDRRLQEFVNTCVGQSVSVMWHTSEAFASKIREHVHSTDYELMFVAPGDVFDPYVMRAQGAQPPPPSKKGDKGKKDKAEDNGWRVLCTTDLGLRRTTNRGKPGDNPPKLDTEVMNKAVVIFEHELESM